MGFEDFASKKEDELVKKEETEKKEKSFEELYREKLFKDANEIFNIKEEELKSVAGFESLSLAQQVLVIENLKQITLGQIKTEAVDRYNQKTIEEISKYTKVTEENVGFLGKIWNQIKKTAVSIKRNVLKEYYIAEEEKRTAEQILHGGIASHGEKISLLVKGIQEANLNAIINEKGEIEILYAGNFEALNLSEEEKKIVSNFNKTAKKFVNIPQSWSLSSATKDQQKKYEKAKKEYEKALQDITPLIKRKYEAGDEAGSALEIADIEKKILFNQLLTTSPKVEKLLKNIESPKLLQKALSNVIVERGLYMGFGYLTRAVTTSILGILGAPIAAAMMGGFIARRRAFENLKQQEELKRRGVKKESEELLILKEKKEAAKKLYQEYIEKKEFFELKKEALELSEGEEAGLTLEEIEEKAKSALEQVSYFEAKIRELQRKEKAFVDAKSLDNKLRRLIDKLDKEIDENKKAEIRGSIKARIEYTEEKIRKGLVNFGGIDEQLFQKYALIKLLTEAQMKINEGELKQIKDVEGLTLEERLNRILEAHEKEVSDYEKKIIREQMLKGAFLGASFAVLGYVIRDFLGTGSLLKTTQSTQEGITEIGGESLPKTPPPDSLTQSSKILYEDSSIVDDSSLTKPMQPDSSLNKLEELISNQKPPQSYEDFQKKLVENFPFLKNDSTFSVDSTTGEIIRKGYPGTYTFDEKGNLVYSGGYINDRFIPPQILEKGSIDESQWKIISESQSKTIFQSLEKLEKNVTISQKQLELATIGKGEGVEHALIRQLQAEPSKFGYKGDLNDTAAIRKWAETKAHQIAIENNYVDPKTGSEIRVKDIGPVGKEGNPAYVLEIDSEGKFKVREYIEGKPSGGEGSVSSYEYQWERPKTAVEETPSKEDEIKTKGAEKAEERKKLIEKEEVTKEKSLDESVKFESLRQKIETLGISYNDYEASIVRPGVTVESILNLHEQKGLDPQWKNFADWLKSLNPNEEELKLKVDDFLKQKIKITELAETSETIIKTIKENLFEFEGGKLKFNYDAEGNPIGIEANFELKGITGEEYFNSDFRKLIDSQEIINKLIATGRQIFGYIKFYEQLNQTGYTKEASFLLETIKKSITEIDSNYKGVIDYEKLPDYLKISETTKRLEGWKE